MQKDSDPIVISIGVDVGIDKSGNTGIAIASESFVQPLLYSISFFDLIPMLSYINRSRKAYAAKIQKEVEIYISLEDTTQDTVYREKYGKGVRNKTKYNQQLARAIGQQDALCKMVIEFARRKKLPIALIPPSARKKCGKDDRVYSKNWGYLPASEHTVKAGLMTKTSSELFHQITGYKKQRGQCKTSLEIYRPTIGLDFKLSDSEHARDAAVLALYTPGGKYKIL